MKIKLDDKHYINSDSQCYWISVEVKPENSKPYEKNVSGYCRTFNEAVNSFIESHIRCAEVDDFKSLVETIDDLKRTVEGWEAAVKRC